MKEYREPESRAPQFAAYESLRGYSDLVEECEFVPDERVELSEEEIEKLSLLLSSLRKGMPICFVAKTEILSSVTRPMKQSAKLRV